MSKLRTQHRTEGFALLLALIITSVALAIGLSLLDVTVKQVTLSATTRESEIAYQAAAAGMDCLVYARSTEPVQSQVDAASFTVDCLDTTMQFQDANSNARVQEYTGEFDWTLPSNQDICIGFTMAVIDTTDGTARTYARSYDLGNAKTCPAGRVCTFAYSSGYNRSCVEKNSGSLFLVQRELTAEF